MNYLIILTLTIVQEPFFTIAHEFQEENLEICAPPRKCVQHYQCFGNGTINAYGENIVYRRYASEDVKHKFDESVIDEETVRNTVTLANGVQAVECTSLERCCEVDAASTPTIFNEHDNMSDDVFRYKGCGFKNRNYHVVPWIVTLVRKRPIAFQSAFLCGGSLIHGRVVLTIAHCLDNINRMDVMVRTGGTLNQERDINDIIVHEYYNSYDLRHDIALVIVDQTFEFNTNIQPICLGQISPGWDREITCHAISWTKVDNNSHKPWYETLKSIEVNVIPASNCQMWLSQSNLGYGFGLHNSFMCAAPMGGEPMPIDGDGGLPLVCPIANEIDRYYQTGIVSWGVGDGSEDFPYVYTDVGAHQDWIGRIMDDIVYRTDRYKDDYYDTNKHEYYTNKDDYYEYD